jgi:ankyrin repeat protein
LENNFATLDEKNHNGDTALLLSAFGGHLSLLKWLLAQGSSPTESNYDGLTALLSAANGGHLNVVGLYQSLNTFVPSTSEESTSRAKYTNYRTLRFF